MNGQVAVASLNPITKELVFKVVFCGPGMGGKTSTLEHLHGSAPAESRGQLVSLATASDRTLYFDFLPLRLPKVRGLHVRMQLFTVPGQVHYAATRKLVLTGADGVVFVADAQRARAEANVESLEDLEANLIELGRTLVGMPHVLQFNKVDLEDVVPVNELEAQLNRHKAPSFRTVAIKGMGVPDTLDAITRLVLDAYWGSVPQVPTTTQRMELRAEGSGIASAVRDWAEGRSKPPSAPPIDDIAHAMTERDLDREAGQFARLAPRKNSIVPPTARAQGVSSSAPSVPSMPTASSTGGIVLSDRGVSTDGASPAMGGVGSAPTASSDDRFSLADLFPDEARTDVRGIEELVSRGDTKGAVLACEVLVGRALDGLSSDRASAWLVAGLDPGNYRVFRRTVAAAKRGEDVAKDAALSCIVWAAAAALATR